MKKEALKSKFGEKLKWSSSWEYYNVENGLQVDKKHIKSKKYTIIYKQKN